MVYIYLCNSLFIFYGRCCSMAHERLEFLETLKDSYSAYYNINENDGLTDLPLVFRADFSSRGEMFLLTKSVKIWANETCEYLYLFSAPGFDVATVEKCLDYAVEDGLPRVKPHKEHQYTNFIAVFVADDFDDEVLNAVKKRRFSKSYKHSLWGFSMLKSVCVNLSTEKLVTNKEGHDLTAFYKKLFAVKRKNTSAGSNKKLFSSKE